MAYRDEAPTLPENELTAVAAQWLDGRDMPEWLARYPLDEFPGLPVRLLNCYRNSKCGGLGEFLCLRSTGRRALRNYGTKSEEALLEALRALAKQNDRGLPVVRSAKATSQDELRYNELTLHEKPWSLVTPKIWESWRASLGAKKNRRVSDIAAAINLKWPANGRAATLDTYLSLPFEKFVRLEGMGRVKMRVVVLCVAHALETESEPEIHRLEDILRLPVLRELDERERFVLERRLLVPERHQITLVEAAGRLHGITRERVRQIEKIVLNRVRESSWAAQIAELLEKEKSDIFQQLSGGELFLSPEKLAAREDDFGGPTLLAIYLEGRTLRAWLDTKFFRVKDSWFGGSAEDWGILARRLAGWRSEQFPLPESIVAGSSNVTVREARAYFACTGNAVIFEGYFLPSGNVLAQRAARLHAFISSEELAARDPIHVSEAWARASGETDPTNHARYGYRALLSTPALFLAAPGCVIPIHQASPWRQSNVQAPEPDVDVVAHSNAEAKIAAVVKRRGPLTLQAAVDECGRLDGLKIAPGSVAAIISQSPHFIRLAPGLYDLRNWADDASRAERARSLLLNEKDVRRYSFARHSGDDLRSMYPLWDAEQEMRWARWGREALDSDMFGSLLAVADPRTWPAADEASRDEWMRRKNDCRWRLKVSWNDDLPSDVPSVRDVLLVAQYARVSGNISWIRANYLLGATQVTERIGLTSVVLSIVLGLVAPTGKSRWLVQSKHPNFDQEWVNYENLLLGDPELSWRSPIIQERFGRSSLLAASGELGWVETNEISVLRSLSTSVTPSFRAPVLDALAPESTGGDDVRI